MPANCPLVRVERKGLAVGDITVPARFFAHGQPGWRFAVFPPEYGRLTHVDRSALKAIVTAYRTWTAASPRRRERAAKKRAALPAPRRPLFPTNQGHPEDAWDRTALAEEADRELQSANALAMHLANLKARMADGEKPNRRLLDEMQTRHEYHIERCLQLRRRMEGP